MRLTNAQADFSQDGYEVGTVVDGQSTGNSNGWAISPQVGVAHTATFQTDFDTVLTGPGRVKIQLFHHYSSGNHRLGRFRLAVTRTAGPLRAGLPGQLAAVVHRDPERRTPEEQAELQDYYLQSQAEYIEASAAWQASQAELPVDPLVQQWERRIAELSQPLPADPELLRLQRSVSLSKEQLTHRRLTFAQDLAWALINSPEFLYNH